MSTDPAPPERLAQLEADLEAARTAATWHEDHARRVEAELIPTRERIRVLDQALVALLQSPAGLFPDQLHALQRALLGSPRAPELDAPRSHDPRWQFKPHLADRYALEQYAGMVTAERDRLLLLARELLCAFHDHPGLPWSKKEAQAAWRSANALELGVKAAEHQMAELEKRSGLCARCGASRGAR